MGGVEEAIDALRNISASLTLKFSHLLNFFIKYKHASSIGAVIGVAFAVVCIWRYLRGGQSPRQPKKHAGASSSRVQQQGGASSSGTSSGSSVLRSSVATATGAAHSITQASVRGAPVKPQVAPVQELTLTSAVRKQLSGGRRMTCQLLGVVLEEASPEELEQGGATVKRGVAAVIKELARSCDLYLLARVNDDASETAVLSALEDAELLGPGAVNKNKVLFCSTSIGSMSFVRQLEPDWHVDTNEETLVQLKRFVRHPLWIAPSPQGSSNGLTATPALDQYFGLQHT
eukprot:TRINITY_DN1994_c0_g1_i1.p1 TRINITY_DN1994_c0_g1~~TRINITY_DN1994_c0_g1_i1.p1  ORF type:complete len:288 (+),score=39.96 TRINITY_DN1994_c0_g1_i1:173-1036(+)